MPREFSDDQINILSGKYIRTGHLFRAEFTNASNGANEVYYLTDYHRNVSFNNTIYTALGHLLGYEGVEESADFQIATVRVSLSAVDLNLVSAVLQYRYLDRQLDIWRAFFSDAKIGNTSSWDDSGSWNDSGSWEDGGEQPAGTPVKIFSGRMGEPTIVEDPDSGTCVVSLSASSHFADFDRRPGRHTNHSEQQAYFLGDRFFEAWGSPDQDLVWGRA
jgi:hypothetical protein